MYTTTSELIDYAKSEHPRNETKTSIDRSTSRAHDQAITALDHVITHPQPDMTELKKALAKVLTLETVTGYCKHAKAGSGEKVRLEISDKVLILSQHQMHHSGKAPQVCHGRSAEIRHFAREAQAAIAGSCEAHDGCRKDKQTQKVNLCRAKTN